MSGLIVASRRISFNRRGVIGNSEREIASAGCRGEVMTSISTLTAVASAICTAFMAFAQPSHSGTSRRGSGDALFSWVDEIIRKTWREQHFSPPWAQATRPTTHRFPDATGSIGNQALTAKSIPGAALPARKRPWPVGRISWVAAQPIERRSSCRPAPPKSSAESS